MTDRRGRLEGKVALVSGGARGLGASIARLFVREGASVMTGDILDELGASTAETISSEEGGRCLYQHLDVTKPNDWAAAVSRCEAELGPVSVLVSNAFKWPSGSILDVTPEGWRQTLDVILEGAFHGMRAVLPGMRAQGKGSIIAVSSSVGGEMAAPDFAAYQAAKAALTALTRHVGGTYAREGIRANALHPGPMRTPALEEHGFVEGAAAAAQSFPIPRIAEPEEVAWGAVYLASDESSYMTAGKLVIDGGSTAFLGSVEQNPPSGVANGG